MISLERACSTDRLMKATTSLTVVEFQTLAARFAPLWATIQQAKTAAGKARKRQPGGGRKGVLERPEEKLFFILLYYKAYPTQDVMGLLFGIQQSQVSQWVKRLTSAVGSLIELHKPTRSGRQLRELLEQQPELQEVIIDGTERRLPRPQDQRRQSRYYSGRKKRHAVKNVVITGHGKVLWCSATVPARRHDKTVADAGRLRLPAEVAVLGDSGFEGFEAGKASVITPWRRRPGRRLHWKRKRFNRLLGQSRVGVEHVFASVKRLRILQDEFRNRRTGMIDEVMSIGCALHNFRVRSRQTVLGA